MRPKERSESGQTDLLRSRLDQILDMDHALVKLAKSIDWRFLQEGWARSMTTIPADRRYRHG